MEYVALLRGINVGGNHKVEMKKLKAGCESLGYTNVSTYINSGNISFETDKNKSVVSEELCDLFKKEYLFDIPTLIKTKAEMRRIAKAIPSEWQNDTVQRTDVAYLFPNIDSKKILIELPFNREYIDVHYVKGTIFWNTTREHYSQSRLNKIIGSTMYPFMTVRNVNTARFLAE